MACMTSEAYHTLEYRHGPKATATSRTLVTIFGPGDVERGESLAHDMKALGAAVLVVAGDALALTELERAVPSETVKSAKAR